MVRNVSLTITIKEKPLKRALALIGLIFVLVYILPLNLRPLVDPDETRYSEIPREMNETHDYVVPRLGGTLYFEKPVMGYWLAAFSMKAIGETPLAGRLPQALAVGLTALTVFFLAVRFGGGLMTGTVAALLYLSCLEVFAVGVFNTLDSLLSFFLTACLALFYLAWSCREDKRKQAVFLALSGLLCGLACHTKGFLAFAVPVSVIVPFLLWERRYSDIVKIPWIPVAVAALVMLPWGLCIHFREPDFWNYFFWQEHVHRFFSGASQHKEPFYYFIPVLVGGIFPHTVLVPAAVAGFRKSGFDTTFKRYLLCWLLFPFLFFSASSGKLATYVLPCFPPLALLLALGLRDALERGADRLFDAGVRVMMLFPVLATVAVLALQNGVSRKTPFLFSDPVKIDLFLIAMTAFLALLAGALKAKDPFRKLILFALSPLVFYSAAHTLTPDQAVRRNSPSVFIEENRDLFTPETLVVATSTPLKAVCWSLKRSDVFLLDDPGELDYGFSQQNMKHRWLTFESFGQMVRANHGQRDIILVLDERRFNRFKERLPEPDAMKSSGKDGYLLVMYR